MHAEVFIPFFLKQFYKLLLLISYTYCIWFAGLKVGLGKKCLKYFLWNCKVTTQRYWKTFFPLFKVHQNIFTYLHTSFVMVKNSEPTSFFNFIWHVCYTFWNNVIALYLGFRKNLESKELLYLFCCKVVWFCALQSHNNSNVIFLYSSSKTLEILCLFVFCFSVNQNLTSLIEK